MVIVADLANLDRIRIQPLAGRPK